MGIRRINHTGVSVADIDRSLTFYRDLLGLELVFDSDIDDIAPLNAVVGMPEARGRVVWLTAGDTMLELWQWDHPSGRPLPDDYVPADRGVTHFAFEVDDVDEVHRRIVDAGYRANVEPQDLGLHKTTYVRGPDGEIIEILEDRVDADVLQRLKREADARAGEHR